MGVLSLSDDLPVWGGNGRVIYSLILFSLRFIGEKPHLLALKQSFDHGYNSADLEPFDKAQLIEFSQAVAAYARYRLWEQDGLGDCEALMDDLLRLISARLQHLSRH
jgi:hypothetical protein